MTKPTDRSDALHDIPEIYENPMEQAFYASMMIQLDISRNGLISDDQRVKALNDLQTTYITHKAVDAHEHTDKQMAKTASKAIDQIDRLRRDQHED